VGCVAMEEKGLKEQGQVPMGYEKDQDCFHRLKSGFRLVKQNPIRGSNCKTMMT
jgi:hypothetical protein